MSHATPHRSYTRRRHVDVMISSTTRDLPAHRKAAIDATWRRSLYPIAMETLPARPADAIRASLDLVDEAEVYVGIFGYRYGYVPVDAARNPGEISITEMEYRRAVERGIPVLIFIMGDDHPGPKVSEHATFFETDPVTIKKLADLKQELTTRYVVSFFNSAEELSGQVFQALTDLIERGVIEATEEVAHSPEESGLPTPPEPHIAHPYILTQKFFGRADELRLLDEWAVSAEHTTMIIDAIGGVGKSALTWEWVQHHAPNFNFDGVLWWSFYESDSAVSNFTRHALAYLTGQTLKAVSALPQDERERLLLAALCEKRVLLVLDGLERILVAYHRIDAPHVLDDEVEQDLRGCTDDRHALLLQKLTECAPTKILISTRLKPSALENKGGKLLPRVAYHHLNGLHSNDALALMRYHDVTTRDEAALLDFMEQFGRHSLLLTVVAGRIGDYRPAPGNFDAWYADEGRDLRLAELELAQRRTGILEYAFAGLKPELRKLLRQAAAFRYPLDYTTISVLNPYQELPDQRASQAQFHAGLAELEDRGLLQWDRAVNRYDLHPIVRAYAFEDLQGDERTATFLQIRDHFERTPPSDDEHHPTEIAHLRRLLEIYHALVGAGLLNDAARFYTSYFSDTLDYHMAAYPVIVELLMPLFPDEIDHLPAIEDHYQGRIVTDLASAFYHLGQDQPALTLFGLHLKLVLDQSNARNLGVGLRNFASALRNVNRLAASQRAVELARDVADVTGDREHRAMSELKIMEVYNCTGQWALAQAAYDAFQANPPRSRTTFWQSAAEQCLADMLVSQGLDATATIDAAEELAIRSQDIIGQRQLHRLRGEVELQKGNPARAADHFHEAIVMVRKSGAAGLATFLGRLAVAYALQGQHADARRLIEEAFAQPYIEGAWGIHSSAAEVFHALGEHDPATEQAITAYTIAWADGPPYSWWWGLDRARKTLAALGVDLPALPPFDPAKVEPIPYEDEIRAFIDDLRAEKG